MTTGEAICRRRKELGMTQEELAKTVGVSGPFIAQLERGSKGLNIATGAKIAEALNCSIMDLIPQNREV